MLRLIRFTSAVGLQEMLLMRCRRPDFPEFDKTATVEIISGIKKKREKKSKNVNKKPELKQKLRSLNNRLIISISKMW